MAGGLGLYRSSNLGLTKPLQPGRQTMTLGGTVPTPQRGAAGSPMLALLGSYPFQDNSWHVAPVLCATDFCELGEPTHHPFPPACVSGSILTPDTTASALHRVLLPLLREQQAFFALFIPESAVLPMQRRIQRVYRWLFHRLLSVPLPPSVLPVLAL